MSGQDLTDSLTHIEIMLNQPQMIYIASFTKDGGNQLAQWQVYGGETRHAYSIGFNPDTLDELAGKAGWRLEDATTTGRPAKRR
jgi:hypothetical protein